MCQVLDKDLLVRNAHRVCFLLFIHDRVSMALAKLKLQNMAMVAGRFPVLPESALFTPASLGKWGKHTVSPRRS